MLQVTDAVILMAGTGSRLGDPGGAVAKPLVPIRGHPLISYALASFARAGVRTIHAVLGPQAELLASELLQLVPGTMRFNPITNPAWRKQNGISVLRADREVTAPFFLAMGDHVFDDSIISELLGRSDPALLNLAIDKKTSAIFDLEDATKVQTDGGRVVAIGKSLEPFDAIDTGLFLCPEELFDYLRLARQDGDCSLSDGVRLMAADGKVRAVDIGDAWWQDVDTPEMLRQAEREVDSLKAGWHRSSGV